MSGSLACDMFVNKDLTSASYVLLRPLVEAMPSRGIIITGNVGYGCKIWNLAPVSGVAARLMHVDDVQQSFNVQLWRDSRSRFTIKRDQTGPKRSNASGT